MSLGVAARWAMNRSLGSSTTRLPPSGSTTTMNSVTTSVGGGMDPFMSVNFAWLLLIHACGVPDSRGHRRVHRAKVTQVYLRPFPTRRGEAAAVVPVINAVRALGPAMN